MFPFPYFCQVMSCFLGASCNIAKSHNFKEFSFLQSVLLTQLTVEVILLAFCVLQCKIKGFLEKNWTKMRFSRYDNL